jgi:2-keto-4-pentenoate hydratase/2-oxohepta-3-ene-1,7-dioic acid hydratase in catechol pathway
MRFFRIQHEGKARFARARTGSTELELLDGAPYAGGTGTSEKLPLEQATLLAPVTPTKIVCIGRNYAAHAKELGGDVPDEPLIFLKPPSSLLATGAAIVLPSASQRVDHEAEIGLVIGRRAKQLSEAEALDAVFAVTCINDVTARDLQRKDVQFTRAKGFDTFCPVGPWLESEVDFAALAVTGRLNGEVRQHAPVGAMVFPLARLVSFISHVMTLEPGDLIATGTPEGVGPLAPGDLVEIEVAGVGVLSNPVRAS